MTDKTAKPLGALITHYDADGKPVSIDFKTHEQLTRRLLDEEE